MNYAILKGHDVIPVDNVLEWGIWFESAERHIAKETNNEVTVSTVFLGLDHGFMGRPLWFETMVFGGPLNGECIRYSTWDEAEEGHKKMVEKVYEDTQ